ncbi:hypothetical protein L2E82_30539 [Cichorium intybus]|uniref:Uncharacterized protein n=1 Tax=Cichorium intybus TaxID=13427 RepID=A0ACB9D108_CICIN|nr:hypothetical protein L2E82_30539 [Cichorium intybus]
MPSFRLFVSSDDHTINHFFTRLPQSGLPFKWDHDLFIRWTSTVEVRSLPQHFRSHANDHVISLIALWDSVNSFLLCEKFVAWGLSQWFGFAGRRKMGFGQEQPRVLLVLIHHVALNRLWVAYPMWF